MIAPERRSSAPRAARSFLLIELLGLAALWLLFSGKLDAVHLSYGALSIALTVLLTRHLIRARTQQRENEFLSHVRWGRALIYPFWLLWQIVVANIEVAKLILGPSSNWNPCVLRFEFPVDDVIARVTLGNSITITPGTFTLRIRGHHFLVHSIHPSTAQGVVDGDMQRRVAELFGQKLSKECEVQLDSCFIEQDRGGDE